MEQSHLLAVEIAQKLEWKIKEWQKNLTVPYHELGYPKIVEPDNLLAICNRVVDESDNWPVSKLHRRIGTVCGCLLAMGICTLAELKEAVQSSKKIYDESEDADLLAHLDPDDDFEIEVGGES